MHANVDAKELVSLIVPELFIGPGIALLGVYFFGKAPNKEHLIDFVDKHIVNPNLEFIEKVGGRTLKAHARHEQYELENIEKTTKEPQKPHIPYLDLPREKRSRKTAELLCMGGVSLVVESTAALLGQVAFNKILKVEKPIHNVFMNVGADIVAHLGAIVVFTTVIPKAPEVIREFTQNFLQSLGMKEKSATDASLTFANVNVPSFFGLGAAVGSVVYGEQLQQLFKSICGGQNRSR